jgi:colanic acid biosynthesis glycosyl transferase WcaI
LRIIAVNRFYRPDHSATAQLLGDLAEHLAASGHDVTIVTSRLQYEGGDPLPARETIAGVQVRRMWTTRFGRVNLAGRAIDYLTFYVSAFFCLVSIGRRDTLLIAKTDPPLISVPAGWACRLRGMKLVNWCQDLFPEIAGALGMKWAQGWVGGVCRWARNRSLKQASLNIVLNEAMAQRISGQGVDSSSIRIIANWPDADIRPVPRDQNTLRAEWGYGPETFVIGYSGNLGRAHMPETIADFVKASAAIDNLAWLFIGGGAGLATLKQEVADLPNVSFKPYQPLARLSESLSVPDAHLISLDPDCEGYIMPSKLYGVVAVERPVLAFAELGAGVSAEVARLDAGIAIDCDAPAETWVAAIRKLAEGGRVGSDSRSHARTPARAQARTSMDAWRECLTAQAVERQAVTARSAAA